MVHNAVGLARLFHKAIGGFRVDSGRGVNELVPVKEDIAGIIIGGHRPVGIPYNPVQVHKYQQIAQVVQLQVVHLPDTAAEYIQAVVIVDGPGDGSLTLPGPVHRILHRVPICIVYDHEVRQVLEIPVV